MYDSTDSSDEEVVELLGGSDDVLSAGRRESWESVHTPGTSSERSAIDVGELITCQILESLELTPKECYCFIIGTVQRIKDYLPRLSYDHKVFLCNELDKLQTVVLKNSHLFKPKNVENVEQNKTLEQTSTKNKTKKLGKENFNSAQLLNNEVINETGTNSKVWQRDITEHVENNIQKSKLSKTTKRKGFKERGKTKVNTTKQQKTDVNYNVKTENNGSQSRESQRVSTSDNKFLVQTRLDDTIFRRSRRIKDNEGKEPIHLDPLRYYTMILQKAVSPSKIETGDWSQTNGGTSQPLKTNKQTKTNKVKVCKTKVDNLNKTTPTENNKKVLTYKREAKSLGGAPAKKAKKSDPGTNMCRNAPSTSTTSQTDLTLQGKKTISRKAFQRRAPSLVVKKDKEQVGSAKNVRHSLSFSGVKKKLFSPENWLESLKINYVD